METVKRNNGVKRMAELLQQIRLPLVTSRQLQLDHELAAA